MPRAIPSQAPHTPRIIAVAAATGLALSAAAPSFASIIHVRASQDLPLAQQDGTT